MQNGPATGIPPKGTQEGIPDSQMYMVNTTTQMMAVTAMASATPSASRSRFVSSDMLYSTGLVLAAQYNSIGRNPKCRGQRHPNPQSANTAVLTL